MKIDYDFLKKILLEMGKNEDYYIFSSELMQRLYPEMGKNDEADHKFIGHIKILFDADCIENEFSQKKYSGFSININNHVIYSNQPYRLTHKGYDFLDMLKNDSIFKKIKNFAIDNAFEIGKQLLLSGAIKLIGQ